jgi:quercetin 2,3-dioxygenase
MPVEPAPVETKSVESASVESMHNTVPLLGELPGEAVPYSLAFGEGARYELGGQLITVIARGEDTAGLYSAAYITGGKGSGSPVQSADASAKGIYVLDGRLELTIDGVARELVPGDSATIPAGTPHAYAMRDHYTRFLAWFTPAGPEKLFERLGTPSSSHVHPAGPSRAPSPQAYRDAAAGTGVSIHAESVPASSLLLPVDGTQLPPGVQPYFLAAGEGERYVADNQMHTYLSRNRNTAGTHFAVESTGGRSDYIGLHYHRLHTENFLCLDGRVSLWANGREILLTKGDYLHAPAGTVHSYAFDSHRTKMLGFLAPGVFEPFFEYLFTPTQAYAYEETGQEFNPMPQLLKAQEELDLVLVGPPPRRGR